MSMKRNHELVDNKADLLLLLIFYGICVCYARSTQNSALSLLKLFNNGKNLAIFAAHCELLSTIRNLDQ